MRCFVAVAPGERLREELSTRLDVWRGILPLAWARPEQFHITLRFLGEWPADRLEALRGALASELDRVSGFPVTPAGLDVFPDWRAPRVLFLRLDDADRLAELAAGVNTALASHCPGFGRPAGAFRAHLTLARIKRPLPPDDLRILRGLDPGVLSGFTVEAVHLVESRLSPAGARYADLAVFPLAGPD